MFCLGIHLISLIQTFEQRKAEEERKRLEAEAAEAKVSLHSNQHELLHFLQRKAEEAERKRLEAEAEARVCHDHFTFVMLLIVSVLSVRPGSQVPLLRFLIRPLVKCLIVVLSAEG